MAATGSDVIRYICLPSRKARFVIYISTKKYLYMKHLITIAALAILFSACKKAAEEKAAETSTVETPARKAPAVLTMKWETEPVLTTCESVLYNEDEDLLYVSNINGAPDAKDGNGFISKVSMDGKVTDPQWVKGLDAPKGMGLVKDKLYVADITNVREIDTKTGKLTHTYPVKGARFLNDITVDKDKVYISDSRGGAIYLIENGKLSTWMKDLHNPNGLFIDGGQLVMALWDDKTLNTVDLSSKEVTMRADSIENPDGVEAIGSSEYLVSSWNGMITHIDRDWKKTLLLDTRSDSVNSADIEYVKSKDLLLVPTFFKNKVVAYEVSK